jgi:uncharacterized PurR-regulated membrane protein YhhQ (DUF165 family)
VKDSPNRLVLAIGALCLVLLVLGCAGWWSAFGVATWPLIYLCAAIGFGGSAARKAVWPVLLAMLAASIALLAAILLTEQKSGVPDLVLGTPLATAFLIYGIWPLGIFIGVLYFRVFDRHVLPQRKLDAFLSEFRRRTD